MQVLLEQGSFCSGFFFSFFDLENVLLKWGQRLTKALVVRLSAVDSIFSLLCHPAVFSPFLCFLPTTTLFNFLSCCSTLTIHVPPTPGLLFFYPTNITLSTFLSPCISLSLQSHSGLCIAATFVLVNDENKERFPLSTS